MARVGTLRLLLFFLAQMRDTFYKCLDVLDGKGSEKAASEILPHEFFFSFFPECREVETDGQKQFKKGELLQQNSPQTENLSLHLVCPYDLPRMDQVFSEFNTLHLRVELALRFFSPGEIKQDI